MSKPHAVIVGFGPGVGFGLAHAFGRAGFSLSLIARNPDKVQNQLNDLKQSGVAIELIKTDASDGDSLHRAVQEAINRLGSPSVLIYNVVAPAQGRPSTIEPADLTRDLNVVGALASARAVLPDMLAQKSGTILCTGGGWALYPSVDFASISIGKAALRSLVFTLAEEMKGTGVRVGTVTIMGTVQPGTAFDPEKIGRVFLDLYNQPDPSFPTEVQFKGA
jgi:short-subunit dehydrogenase